MWCCVHIHESGGILMQAMQPCCVVVASEIMEFCSIPCKGSPQGLYLLAIIGFIFRPDASICRMSHVNIHGYIIVRGFHISN